MKSPWYPRYTQDITGSTDCRMMSWEEFGLYNWLLDFSWNNESKPCYLENNPEKLARMTGGTLKRFVVVFAAIQKKFKLYIDPETHQEYIYNPRLLAEYEKRLAQGNKQEERAKKAAKVRWSSHASSNATSIPQALPMQCLSDSPLQSQSYKKKHIANSSRYTGEFEEFWGQSSQRGSKWEAFQVWERIPVETRLIAKEAMIHAVAHEWIDIEKRLIPHVVRWLRGRRWEGPKAMAATAKVFPI